MKTFVLASLLVSAAALAQSGAAAPAAAAPAAAAPAAAAPAAAAPAAAEPAAAPVSVKLINLKSKPAGTATLTQTAHGVLIKVDLHGLTPGVHAIHLHEAAKCEPPFKTAGGHFNPAHKQHGFMQAEGPHGGDLPNLDVPAGGKVKAELIAPDASLDALLANGAALVVHAKADDYKSQPAGDAGDRIACGVIQK